MNDPFNNDLFDASPSHVIGKSNTPATNIYIHIIGWGEMIKTFIHVTPQTTRLSFLREYSLMNFKSVSSN